MEIPVQQVVWAFVALGLGPAFLKLLETYIERRREIDLRRRRQEADRRKAVGEVISRLMGVDRELRAQPRVLRHGLSDSGPGQAARAQREIELAHLRSEALKTTELCALNFPKGFPLVYEWARKVVSKTESLEGLIPGSRGRVGDLAEWTSRVDAQLRDDALHRHTLRTIQALQSLAGLPRINMPETDGRPR